jgi:hypothetical protein
LIYLFFGSDEGRLMRVEDLLVKHLHGKALERKEIAFLRANLTPVQLETIAIGPLGRDGASRKLFKLWNKLFATKDGPTNPLPSGPQKYREIVGKRTAEQAELDRKNLARPLLPDAHVPGSNLRKIDK